MKWKNDAIYALISAYQISHEHMHLTENVTEIGDDSKCICSETPPWN